MRCSTDHKTAYDEIVFVPSKATKAEHTKRYVSISISAALVQKELIRTILYYALDISVLCQSNIQRLWKALN